MRTGLYCGSALAKEPSEPKFTIVTFLGNRIRFGVVRIGLIGPMRLIGCSHQRLSSRVFLFAVSPYRPFAVSLPQPALVVGGAGFGWLSLTSLRSTATMQTSSSKCS